MAEPPPARRRRYRPDVDRRQHVGGTSSRSGSLRFGTNTVVRPARWAASSFCFTPPIGSTRPFSVTSPVIPTSERTGRPSRHRGQRGHHRDAGRRTVLRAPRRPARARGCAGPGRRVGDAELLGVRPDVGQRDLRRLLHHVAQLAGQRQARRLPSSAPRLDEQHVAAEAGDRQAGRDARHRRPLVRLRA